jgi:uncharacterized protein YbjT (DUF2867 family)
MNQVLVLGATGRAGSATLAHLAGRVDTVAALRTDHDRARLPEKARTSRTVVIDLDDAATLRRAVHGADVIVNAIRLRDDIPA